MTLREFLYILALVLVSYGVYASGVNLITIFSLNGAVIGYVYVFWIPIWIHLKCIYYDRSGGHVEGDEEWNSRIKPNICQCDRRFSSRKWVYAETVLLIGMLIFGIVMVVFTFIELFAS